jgi:hypothetical protein
MFILPGDFFSSYIDGRRMAEADNWRDIDKFNINEGRQFANLGSMLAMELALTGRPGALATTRAQSNWQYLNADAEVVNEHEMQRANRNAQLRQVIALDPGLGRLVGELARERYPASHRYQLGQVYGMGGPPPAWDPAPGPSGTGAPGGAYTFMTPPGSAAMRNLQGEAYQPYASAVLQSPSAWAMRQGGEPANARTDLFRDYRDGRYYSGTRQGGGYR